MTSLETSFAAAEGNARRLGDRTKNIVSVPMLKNDNEMFIVDSE
jgi:hypothetical protein